jgi:N-acetylglutamate synthase-like GNAT family acetyltransferase
MEDVIIQQYSNEFHDQVSRLVIEIQRTEFGVPITLEQQPDLNEIENFYQKGNGNFWIALAGEKVVGTVALIDIGSQQLALRKMFVDKDYRGGSSKTGQLLLDRSIEWMHEKESTEVFLGTLDIFAAAQKFYRKNGFEEIPMSDLPVNFPKMKLDNTFFVKKIGVNSSLTVIPFEEKHQPSFEKFNREWIEKHFWMEPIDFQVLQNPSEFIIQKGGEIFMASVGEKIVGTVALKFVENGVFEFTKMAVDEKFRGKKIGRMLANAAIEKARSLGARKIILYSNTVLKPAIDLYRKLGFVEVPVDGIYKRSDIKMELIL